MYVVREGKRRGRGHYLTTSLLYDGNYFYHYSREQKKATRFASPNEAMVAAASVVHVETARCVRLRRKSEIDNLEGVR